jgi:hypothetical protein
MCKFSACRALLGTIFPQYLKIPLYYFLPNIISNLEYFLLCNMDGDVEAAAEEEVVAEQMMRC